VPDNSALLSYSDAEHRCHIKGICKPGGSLSLNYQYKAGRTSLTLERWFIRPVDDIDSAGRCQSENRLAF